MGRVSGRKAERHAPIHDVFAQTHRHFSHAIGREFVAHGVIIERASHAGKRRVEMVGMLLSHRLLNDNRHFFLVDNITCCHHIRLAIGKKHRSIDPFHRIGQQTDSALSVGEMRHHIGGIDPGKRLIVAIFEQARATHREGSVEHIVERIEVSHHRFGKVCIDKRPEDFGVGDIGKRQRIERVSLHKLVEHIGAKHHGVWDANHHAFKIVAHRVVFDHRIDKCQSPTLTAKATLTDTCKIAISVETVFVKFRHHAPVFHFSIFHDEVEKELSHGRSLANVAKSVHFHHLSNGEERARIEPSRNVVALSVVEQRIGGDVEHIVLKLLQISDTHYFLARLRVDNHKIAKAEILHHGIAQVDR